MKRPKFVPIFTKKSEFCEICVSKPVSTFVPKQSISISELMVRFEKGQRLNVHSNFAPGSNLLNITDEEALARIKAESMDTDDFPPTGVTDIADVEAHYKAHQEHKGDYVRRQKEKKNKSQQAPPTPPAQQDLPPQDVKPQE